jgi:hypothetical protein
MENKNEIVVKTAYEICYNYSRYGIDIAIRESIRDAMERALDIDLLELDDDIRYDIIDEIENVILTRLYTNNIKDITNYVKSYTEEVCPIIPS